MKDNSLIGRIIQIEKGEEHTIELHEGFFEGFQIDADYKDRKAMEIIQHLSDDIDDCKMQDILDVANRVVAWVGMIEVLSQNNVGGSEHVNNRSTKQKSHIPDISTSHAERNRERKKKFSSNGSGGGLKEFLFDW